MEQFPIQANRGNSFCNLEELIQHVYFELGARRGCRYWEYSSQFSSPKCLPSWSSLLWRKRKKAVIFCLSADKKCIIVEEGKEILVGDVGVTITDPFKHFVGMLPEKDCRYALYDASFETKESRKEELMFFLW